jgi:acetolactate synthase I/II/III large subunit
MDAARQHADVRNCAEEILFLLRAQGVDYLFLNPGTDSAPLQEAATALAARNVAAPQIVTSSFESVALAAAHGYWQMTRRAQAVFVHVDVGTQNLGAMVHNVLRDRAGAVVLAGRTPYAEHASAPGGRSNRIHWMQDVPDQAGIVRGYAKWTFELTRSEDAARVVGRAVQVAGGGRPGLSYLTISRDVLMQPAGPAELRRTARFARPTPPAMEPTALSLLAGLLATAQRPVAITSRLGRKPEGVLALARLADLATMPVVCRPDSVNIPTSHPMRVASDHTSAALIREADLLVLIDCDVPWIPRRVSPSPGATVVQIDDDPVRADMPLWSFPVDLAVTADGALATAQLADALQAAGGPVSSLAQARRAWLAVAAGAQPRQAGPAPGASHETLVRDVVIALNDHLDPEDVVIEEAVSNTEVVTELLTRTEPGTLCSAGSPGLGWALGASVGVKLARPSNRAVAVVGDGAFMFGVPTAALCLAAEARAPFIAVVLNNNGYRASRLPVLDLFPDGVSAADGVVVGTRFASPPDLAAVARACGAHGERVEAGASREDLDDALRRAFKAADDGRAAVLDVVVSDQ